jgi:molecular chaperone DnaJ
LKGSRRGDLYYTINVEFPDKLSEAEEKSLRDIAAAKGTKIKAAKKGLFGR